MQILLIVISKKSYIVEIVIHGHSDGSLYANAADERKWQVGQQ